MLTNLNWDDQKSEVLVNPAYSEFEKLKFSRIATASGLNGHIWLATSGSLVQKWVGISKAALLCSAAAVNDHFNLTASDVWGLALPTFHVAGISILARAYLSNAKVCHFSSKWSATDFINFLKIKNI